MASFEIKMWWSVLVIGLILIVLGAAASKRNWWLVTALSGLLVAGLFMWMTETLWWMAD